MSLLAVKASFNIYSSYCCTPFPRARNHEPPLLQAVHLEGDRQAEAEVLHPLPEGPGHILHGLPDLPVTIADLDIAAGAETGQQCPGWAAGPGGVLAGCQGVLGHLETWSCSN